MVEHNPPPPCQSVRVPVIPLPVALYVSDGLTFELYEGGQPPAGFRSVGRDSFQRQKRTKRQPLNLRVRSHAHGKISPAQV
jgi:hypothetical protein